MPIPPYAWRVASYPDMIEKSSYRDPLACPEAFAPVRAVTMTCRPRAPVGCAA